MAMTSMLEFASATDVGVVRKFNEDSVAIDEEIGLMILADGMGGYLAGDVASAMATTVVASSVKVGLADTAMPADPELSRHSDAVRVIKQAAERANQSILKIARKNSQYQGMGTTLTLALFHDDRIAIAHVGDSRLYRMRYDRLQQLTLDHSLLQDQIKAGMIDSEEARTSHNRNLVTRALGKEDAVEIDLREEDVLPGDIYLICSDGLNDLVEDADIELTLRELKANLPLAAKVLVQMANDNGGHDNVSVLIAQVREFPAKRSLSDRLFGWMKG